MLRRALLHLAAGSLLIAGTQVVTAVPARADVTACKTWCLWDQPRFSGNMVELSGDACKDFAVRSAANNTGPESGKTAIFFFRQPGCQGPPANPYGMKSKTSSPHVNAVSAQLKPATR
jgi:hypothetical protein